MEARLRIKFEHAKDDFIRCIVLVDNREFIVKQKVHAEADRISPVKRAKQKAFVRAMPRVIGHIVDRIKEKS